MLERLLIIFLKVKLDERNVYGKKTRVFEVGRLKILSKKKGLMGSYRLQEDASIDDN